MGAPARAPKRGMRTEHRHIRRLNAVSLAGMGFALVLTLRLVSLQLWAGETYTDLARRQHEKRTVLLANRGRILDRRGRVLATNLEAQSFFVNRRSECDSLERPHLDTLRAIAVRFSRHAGEDEAEILRRLRGKRSFVWLARKVVGGLPEGRLQEGVGRVVEMRRIYPMGTLAGQVLGYTNIDNVGIEGSELRFEALLKGKEGEMVSRVDAHGKTLGALGEIRRLPEDGADLVLTIDADYQSIAEEELGEAVAHFQARNGIVVVMEPASGEILAMADVPLYDPNDFGRCDPEVRRNRAVTDLYEPGSTFKAIAVAGALEEGAVRPEDPVFCEDGAMPVAGGAIRDVHPSAWLSVREIIEVSSNIGMVKVARKLGDAGFFRYMRTFGFGSLTGVSLPGEVAGEVKHPSAWSKRSLETMSIGQEVGVTALQMAAAYGVIANGGRLVVPRIFMKVVRGDSVLQTGRPEVVRQVISPRTAATVASFLEGAVSRGTGANARVAGYRVAGKTGTAQRAREGAAGYDPDCYVSSFIGFLPAERPELLCLVVVDSPRETHWGSQVAAPVFSRIMQRILSLRETRLRHRASAEGQREAGSGKRTPSLKGLGKDVALRALARRGFASRLVGEGDWVVNQATADAAGRKEVLLYVAPDDSAGAEVPIRVPDVVGIPLRQAIFQLTSAGLKVRASGSGWVAGQMPQPGATVGRGAVCRVTCRTRG